MKNFALEGIIRLYKVFYNVLAAVIISSILSNNCLALDLSLFDPNKKAKYFILAVDGGGIRGIVPARILQEIEHRTGKPIYQLFDFMVGVSTGGLITIALATPDNKGNAKYTAKDLVTLYQKQGGEIFSRSAWWKAKTGYGLWGAKYDRSNLDAILEGMLGNTLLSNTLKPIMALSYSIDNGESRLWTTHYAKASEKQDFYLKDIAGATTAAPTYFEPKVLKNKLGDQVFYEADGGIFATNPAIMALSEGLSITPSLRKEEVMLLSIGTGRVKLNKPINDLKNAGIIGWVKDAGLIDVIMSATAEVTEWQASVLNFDTVRIQLELDKSMTGLDNASEENIAALLEATEEYIKQNNASIDALCKKLLERS